VDLVINLLSKRPAYLQLADKLRAAIDAGELEVGNPVPSLRQLAEETGLAVGTIQKTIRLLEREHYVYSVSGRGTFVTPRNHGPLS
jgi:GntR family transcriptional regulator